MAYLMKMKEQVSYQLQSPDSEYKESDSINIVQSSLKSHPLWVTL